MNGFHRFPGRLSAVLLVSLGAGAAQAQLNDTGQQTCYDNGAAADCVTVSADTGNYPRQDARFGRDAAATAGVLPKTGGGAAGFDFTKIANDGTELPATAALGSGPKDWACTRDNVTGRIWEVKTTDSGFRDQGWTYTWYDGSTGSPGNTATCNNTLGGKNCNTQNYVINVNADHLCGYTGWRLPTTRELLSIVDNRTSDPAIDVNYFPNTPSTYSWSADTTVWDSTIAWFVPFNAGGAGIISKTFNAPVRLVRSEVPLPPGADLTDNLDGTVTDRLTGLMWDKCSWGQAGVNCSGGIASTHTWVAALGVAVMANAMNSGAGYKGYNDWRLPSKNELESLVDRSKFGPAIDASVFPNMPNTQPYNYWVSTTCVFEPASASAWNVEFAGGGVGPDSKTDGFHVRLVRSGQSFDLLKPITGGIVPALGPWSLSLLASLLAGIGGFQRWRGRRVHR